MSTNTTRPTDACAHHHRGDARVVHTDHPQVTITHGDTTAQVDEDLGPLILAMWRAGIRTAYSCQEAPPRLWRAEPEEKRIQIVLDSPDDLKALLGHVATSHPLVEGAYYSSGPSRDYNLLPTTNDGVAVRLRVAVYIPHSQIDALTLALDTQPEALRWL
jgi:hypothetical protein